MALHRWGLRPTLAALATVAPAPDTLEVNQEHFFMRIIETINIIQNIINMTKKSFPLMVNKSFEEGLNRFAEATVKLFNSEIFPLLLNFGLLDDKHIEKYLTCDTVEDIYKDALTENPNSIYAMEQQAFVEELKENPKDRVDVWSILRDPKSEVKSPKEEGFIFRSIPGSDSRNRKTILKALSVKDLKFHIDTEYLTEASIVHPTDSQIELYNMLSDFCEAFNKKDFHKKRNILGLFSSNKNGIYPNIYSILGLSWLQKRG